MDHIWILDLFVFAFGLVIGSFLNVCIYRLPRGAFLAESRSRCPSCGTTLRWVDLAPVLSYLLLRGKCRYCEARISPVYPMIESLNGVAWLCAFKTYDYSLSALLVAILLSALIVIAAIDIGHRIIPDSMHVVILILALVRMALVGGAPLMSHVIGAFAVSVPLLIAAIVTKGGMGGGDIKLMAAAGLFLGYKLILFSLLAGSVVGAIVSVALMSAKKLGMKSAVPFGPFLAFGIALAALRGDAIITWYVSIL